MEDQINTLIEYYSLHKISSSNSLTSAVFNLGNFSNCDPCVLTSLVNLTEIWVHSL
ncbi:hypothetical protein Npun_R1531 [Nostoc punctiforme PCC 73102]|uniref:Uncharacterized protein n=1 Tax=Nostoc punctiforme (strain ATCC 29133 / PCC 73102) TaxID=63737 RepID=B2J0K3_NOSP7|nr:hypothetical protein Npun_R1531 [Nostoc punctiforme PCC 73102]